VKVWLPTSSVLLPGLATPCLGTPRAAQAGCSDLAQGPPWPTGTARDPNVHTPSSPGCRTLDGRLPSSPAALSPRHPTLTVPAGDAQQQRHRDNCPGRLRPAPVPTGSNSRCPRPSPPATTARQCPLAAWWPLAASTRPRIRSRTYSPCQVWPTTQVQGDDQFPSFQHGRPAAGHAGATETVMARDEIDTFQMRAPSFSPHWRTRRRAFTRT